MHGSWLKKGFFGGLYLWVNTMWCGSKEKVKLLRHLKEKMFAYSWILGPSMRTKNTEGCKLQNLRQLNFSASYSSDWDPHALSCLASSAFSFPLLAAQIWACLTLSHFRFVWMMAHFAKPLLTNLALKWAEQQQLPPFNTSCVIKKSRVSSHDNWLSYFLHDFMITVCSLPYPFLRNHVSQSLANKSRTELCCNTWLISHQIMQSSASVTGFKSHRVRCRVLTLTWPPALSVSTDELLHQ